VNGLKREVIIAIDGGGTYTRALATDFKGNILSSAVKEGSHPQKSRSATENVHDSIKEVIARGNIDIEDIQIIVGGFAGLNTNEDMKWVEQLTNLEGLQCEKVLVNDAVIARKGAFLGKSGIVCIAGTGSAVLGLNEDGRLIKSYDFQYKTYAAARYFSYEALFYLITKKTNKEQSEFVSRVFEYWGVKNIDELSNSLYYHLSHVNPETIQKLSQMASMVISHAENGDIDLENLCIKVLKSLSLGANIVSSRFSENTIPISLMGGVFNSTYMRNLMQDCLADSELVKKYSIIEPQASPIVGAMLIAYERIGVKLDKVALDKMIDCEKRLKLYN
jgi:glucosamine kinase